MRKPKLILVCFGSALALALLFIGSARYLNARAKSGQTLRERAQQAGGRLVVTDTSHHHIIYHNLLQMAHDSPVIVVGTTVSNRCKLSADEQNVTTDYQVHIEEVLKGRPQAGDVITVSTPGGLKVFDQMTSALIQVPDFRRPINGRTYLFFLGSSSSDVFPLTGGFQGAFELPANGQNVKPSDMRESAPVSQNYKNKDVASFLKEVRLASQP